MIIQKKSEGYDGSFRLVLYKKDEEGKTVAQRVKSDLDDQIATFYEQRRTELERLQRELVQGRISPISLFMQYENMTLADLAARIKLSRRKVKRHLTAAGFRDVTVEQLQRYAKVFDVAVCEFFQFITLEPGLSFETKNERDRLIQFVDVKPEKTEP